MVGPYDLLLWVRHLSELMSTDSPFKYLGLIDKQRFDWDDLVLRMGHLSPRCPLLILATCTSKQAEV